MKIYIELLPWLLQLRLKSISNLESKRDIILKSKYNLQFKN